jgi:hypothetical protein
VNQIFDALQKFRSELKRNENKIKLDLGEHKDIVIELDFDELQLGYAGVMTGGGRVSFILSARIENLKTMIKNTTKNLSPKPKC